MLARRRSGWNWVRGHPGGQRMRCGEAGKYGGGATGCTAPLMHCSLALQAATLVAIHASFAAAVRNCSAFAIGGVQLDFRSGPPHDTRSRPLQSCRAMSAYTCCTQRDDAAVVAAQRAFLLDGGGATPCARLASAVLCAACHGEVGTRALKGVDPTLCDSWFSACRDHWFANQEGSHVLRPCLHSDLVCARLRDIVPGGRQYCERVGVPMCPVDAARRYAGCYRGDAPSRVASIAVRPRPSAQQAADAGWDSRWMWAVLGVAIAASWAVRSRR